MSAPRTDRPRVRRLSWRDWVRASLVLFLGFCSAPERLPAAGVETAWVQHFRPPRATNLFDAPRCAGFDASGNVILLGNTEAGIDTTTVLTVKFSHLTGEVLWKRNFAGSAQLGAGARALAVGVSGNVVVGGGAGYLDSEDNFYVGNYSAADGAILWENRAEGAGGRGFINAVATDASGNVFVAGYAPYLFDNARYFIAKYAAADGALLWVKHSSAEVMSMVTDGSGNLIVAGNSYLPNTDIFTAQLAAADGAPLWVQLYNGPDDERDEAKAVVLDSGGNVIVLGASENSDNYDLLTVKYDGTTGAPLWSRRYNSAANVSDYPEALSAAPNGDVLITGYSYSDGRGVPHILRYAAANGDTLWERHSQSGAVATFDADGHTVVYASESAGDVSTRHLYTYTADGTLLRDQLCEDFSIGSAWPLAIRVEPAGDVVMGGTVFDDRARSFFAARMAASDARVLWQNRVNGPGYLDATAIAVATDTHGDVAVLANVSNGATYDHYLSKFAAASGALLWTRTIDGQIVDPSRDLNAPVDGEVAFDAAGNVIVTAYAIGLDRRFRYHTSKHASADGAVLWKQEHEISSYDGGGQTMALDASGNVIVVAHSYADPGFDSYVVKYAASDGAVRWEKHCDDLDVACHALGHVAVDGVGDVAVTGYSSDGRAYIAKLSGLDGSVLWEQTHHGSTVFVATDTQGNVIVAGIGFRGTSGNFRVAKYAAPDGGLLWEGYLDGPSDSYDPAHAAAIDATGHVVVTGASWNGASYYDMLTAVFSPDGTPLWSRGVRGPDRRYDGGAATAFAANGNIIVTGYSHSFDPSSSELYVAEYARTNGAIVWEKRYNVAANPGGSRSLAIAPGGAILVGGQADGGFDGGQNLEMVLIQYVAPPTLTRLPGQEGYRVEFSAVPGLSYTLQRAASPAGPWHDLVTLTAPASGRLGYTDSQPLTGSAFYRTVTQ